ncbi:MAG: TonB family protein [Crocinitomix sp.]|nr:TonB family protein [Crocinitomix sp.]
MELKKSKKANLESKKNSFRLLGLVMICAMVGMAFEHTGFTASDGKQIVQDNSMDVDLVFEPIEEEPPIEEEEITPPPPLVIDEPVIVPDDQKVKDIDFDIDKKIVVLPEVDLKPPTPELPVDFPDVDPIFPGGAAAMQQWIVDNVDYPELAREMGEQGKVYVKFVVDRKGNIEKVSIRKGVSDALDAEAKRVVRKMPNWIPGEKDGKPVSVNFTLPIHFRLG